MRRSQQRICLGFWCLCAAGVLAVCIGFGSAATLRSKKSNAVAPNPAAVSDGRAALATPPVQIASSKAALKPLVTLPSVRPAAKTDQATRIRLTKAYGKLPLSFEANQGQTDPRVRFFSRGQSYSLFLTGDGAVLSLRSQKSGVRSRLTRGGQWSVAGGRLRRTTDRGPRTTEAFFAPLIQNPKWQIQNASTPQPESRVASPESRVSVLRLKLVGANSSAKVAGVDELPGKSNYFHGNDPRKWRTNVSNYAKVRYEQVYPGIDLLYYGNQRQLEYDFVVAPGADPGAIKLAIEGAEDISVDGSGNVVAQVSGGRVVLNKPVVYQNAFVNPKSPIENRKSVEGRYALVGKNQVAFEVASYDRSLPLIIDPVLSYSTFLGGSDEDELSRMAVDSDGNAYVIGATGSPDFPLQSEYQSTNNGTPDVFVTKLNSSGTAPLMYSTYLGGGGLDLASGIAVDASGDAYLTGYTESSDFPIWPNPGAYQTTLAGAGDAFVTKLYTSGSLAYSTYLGGSTDDGAYAIGVDSGYAYVAGYTVSDDFPTTTDAYDRMCGSDGLCDDYYYYDVFVTRFNPSGSGLLYSTFLGGSDDDVAYDLVLDSYGRAYVTGYTYSTDFPRKSAYDSTCGTDGQCDYDGYYIYKDAFVAKINAGQSADASLVYSTYLGGSGDDEAYAVAADTSGNAYVTGYTDSTNFPSTSVAYQTSLPGYGAGFVTKLNPSGSALSYSTYLGGSDYDWGMAIAVDSSGNAYVVGGAYSIDFPTLNPIQDANAGYSDLFVSRLNAAGSSLAYSTYLGGSDEDDGYGIALGPGGSVYVAGYTYSPDFPTTDGVWDTTCGTDVNGECNYDGSYVYADGFVAKIVPLSVEASVAPSSLTFAGTLVNVTSASQAVTVSNIGQEVVTISDITITGPDAGDFDQSGCTDGSVPAGSSCTINVTFTPTATGSRTATLTITHNAPAPGSTADVSLSGTGANFSVDAASGSSTEQTVAAGSTATYNLTITPNGFSGTASLSCTWVSTQPRGTSCIPPPPVALSGTTPQNVTVRVTTTKGSMVGPSMRLPPPGVGSRLMVPWFLWLAGLGMLAMLAAGSRGNQRVWLRRATPFGALLFFILLWGACGGGGGGGGGGTTPTGTPAGTYTLKVTTTAGGASRDITLTLHVTAQ
jgi:hypothetical protein